MTAGETEHDRRRSGPIFAGFVLSVVLHAVGLPLLIVVLGAAAPSYEVQSRFDPEDFAAEPEMPEPPEPEVDLGIDAPNPSTLTWIGHEEYEEHLARLAEIEQAAFTESPAGAPVPPVEAAQAQAEPAEAAPDSGETEAVEEASAAAPPAVSEQDQVAFETLVEMLRAAAEAPVRPEPEPETPAQPKGEMLTEWLDQVERLAKSEQAKAVKDAKPEPTEKTKPAEEKTAQKPAEQPSEEPGEVANKESDPTSIIEVPLEELRLGKPLAREGLELKTKRPRLTNLIKATAGFARNPLVQIRFGRNGRPLHEGTGVLESCGDGRIDFQIENSLYGWRAKGKALEELPPKGHLDVKIRIMFGR